jgi:hypothetical protein
MGLCQSDHVNRKITLSVITLSGTLNHDSITGRLLSTTSDTFHFGDFLAMVFDKMCISKAFDKIFVYFD